MYSLFSETKRLPLAVINFIFGGFLRCNHNLVLVWVICGSLKRSHICIPLSFYMIKLDVVFTIVPLLQS